MKWLGLIPARAGSRGVPGKNHIPLAGKSLVERAFEVALRSGLFHRIACSTDDVNVMALAHQIGLEVLVRPAALARDETPMLDVALHAMQQAGQECTGLMILQPTSPLRRAEHLRTAAESIRGHDSVCSVVPLPRTHSPHYVMKIEGGLLGHFLEEGHALTRRQDAPEAFVREGTVYAVRASTLLQGRTLYGARCYPLVLDPSESLSIDTWEDWGAAEARIRGGSLREAA